MNNPSDDYWDRRAAARMKSYLRDSARTMAIIARAYDLAMEDIMARLEALRQRMGRDLTPEGIRRYLNGVVTEQERQEVRARWREATDPEVRSRLRAHLVAPAYAARMARLTALREDIYTRCKLLAEVEIKRSSRHYVNTIQRAYYRTQFDLQRGLGIGFDFAPMPTRQIEEILTNPWSGDMFSERVWSNTDKLADELMDIVTPGLMTGQSNETMTRKLAAAMDSGKEVANRAIRTETTYVANAAEMTAYEEDEIERYMYVATLDLQTSRICRELDRQVFNVKDAKAGVNLPSMHPYCRSTTRAYLGPDMLEGMQRRARDPVTGQTVLVPATMTYAEWHASLGEQHGVQRIAALERMHTRKSADQKQYKQYKALLGNQAPKSFAAFRELKYAEDGEGWQTLRQAYRTQNTVEREKVASGSDFKADKRKVNSKAYANKYDGLFEQPATDASVRNAARRILQHRDGTPFEDMQLIDLQTGAIRGTSNDSTLVKRVKYNKSIKDALKEHPPDSLVAIHNHPEGFPPSPADLNAVRKNTAVKYGMVVGHNGTVYRYTAPNQKIAPTDYEAAYKVYKRLGYAEETAQLRTLQDLQEKYQFVLEVL